MSYNVLVIPEDPTKDGAILKPLVEKMMAELGRPQATVEVCRDPSFGGISQCLDVARLKSEVVEVYAMVNLFLLIVDRDGQAGRAQSLASVETKLRAELGAGQQFFAENAWQEVEVFILAGHDLPKEWSWADIRADADVKNTYFAEFARAKKTGDQPHEGRKKLMAEAIKNWTRIKSRCREDVGNLIERMNGKL